MKRITYWPQIVLGLAFSWGALMGWPAAFGRLDWPALVLYAGSISWVIGYDTIYAHQDREDDLLIGIKSTALLFGDNTRPMLAGFYAGAVVLIGIAGLMAGGGLIFVLGLIAFAAHLAWQVAAPRHQRSRALPEAVQIEPRRRADPVRARCCWRRCSRQRGWPPSMPLERVSSARISRIAGQRRQADRARRGGAHRSGSNSWSIAVPVRAGRADRSGHRSSSSPAT